MSCSIRNREVRAEASPFALVEPRIPAIAQEIQRLLNYVTLEEQGRPLRVDGFRLRDNRAWRTGRVRNAADALGSFSGTCPDRCSFCFEQGIPFPRDRSILSVLEAGTRLRHMDLEAKRGLFPPARPHLEPFTNPHVLEILAQSRLFDPDSLLVLTTNGRGLTGEAVDRLARMKPLLIRLSLNIADADLRLQHMGVSSRPETARKAPALLRDARIPFVGSIVAGAGIPKSAIAETVDFFEEFEPYGIRIRLPYAHRFMPSKCLERSTPEAWDEMLAWVAELAAGRSVPVWAEPAQSWLPPLVPRIDGVVRNSPAALAGIQPGDEVVRIGDEVTCWRDHLRVFVGRRGTPSLPLDLEILRQGRPVRLRITSEHLAGSQYPYTEGLGHPSERLGLIVLPDVLVSHVWTVVHCIQRHNAEMSVVFASPLCSPTIRKLLESFRPIRDALGGREVHVAEVSDQWMQGNSDLFESRFVVDYERALRKLLPSLQRRPDLLVLPDALGSEWGVDLTGRSIRELTHRTGIPIALVDWPLIYGREE